jgi:nicotinate-nucleotide adenylyltransferase
MGDTRKIGLFGGTFNPIHAGHVRAAVSVAGLAGLDKVIFIPSAMPPHKPLQNHVSSAHRLEMVKLAIRDESRLDVSDIEIARGGQSYTLDTMQILRTQQPGAHFTFILGVDAYLEIHLWHRYREVLPLADWAVIARPGYKLPSLLAPLSGFGRPFHVIGEKSIACDDPPVRIFYVPILETDVSSSQVRDAIRQGRPIRGMVPEKVAEYIEKNHLYEGTASGI